MSTKGRIDRASSQERQARLRREQLEDQIAGEVLAAQQAVAAARQQIEVARQQVTAAEGALTVFRERYANGLGLQLDVLAAQRRGGSPAERGAVRSSVRPGASGTAEPAGRTYGSPTLRTSAGPDCRWSEELAHQAAPGIPLPCGVRDPSSRGTGRS